MADEGYVQVAPDSTGKRIRNVDEDRVQQDGSTKTVFSQRVALHEEDRELLSGISRTLARILAAQILTLQFLSHGRVSSKDVESLASDLT